MSEMVKKGCKDTNFIKPTKRSIKLCVKMCLTVNNIEDYSYLCTVERK